MHRKFPALDRHERFHGFLGLVKDVVWLGKLSFAALLLWVSWSWISDIMKDSNAALFLHGLAQDAVAKFFSVFKDALP